MKEKKYYDVVTKLDDSGFKEIPFTLYCDKDELEPECEGCSCEFVCKNACTDLSQCTREGGKCEYSYYHCDDAHTQIIKNLLSMFTLHPNLADFSQEEKREVFGCSISDYAWTKEVEEAFWNHPLHKGYVKEVEKYESAFAMFKLDIEPCIYNDDV